MLIAMSAKKNIAQLDFYCCFCCFVVVFVVFSDERIV